MHIHRLRAGRSSQHSCLSSNNQPDAQYVSARLCLKFRNPSIYMFRLFMKRHQGERT